MQQRPTDAYFITGGTGDTGSNIYNWTIRDNNSQVSNSEFKTDTMIAGVAFVNVNFQVPYFQNYNTAKWFNDATEIKIYGGSIYGGSTTQWTQPAVFIGRQVLGFTEQVFGLNVPATDHITLGATQIYGSTGSPNGVVTAPPGSLLLNAAGGAATSLYVKESGSGNTGWIGK